MARPAVILNPGADFYARKNNPNEKVINIVFADGSGCNVSLTNGPPNKIEVYALTAEDIANIVVVAPDGCLYQNRKEQAHE